MQGGVSVSAPEFADLNLSIPPLHRWLDAVIGASPEDSVAPQHGPRRWWPGPLDVEGLALGALQAVATALHRYPAGRARFSVTSAPSDTPSPYGPLRYVPPPLGRDGGPLEYPTPPQQYGSSPLSWTGPEKVVW